jgi:hypothetical protein
MALQPFVEHWPLFQFLDPIHSVKGLHEWGIGLSQGLYYAHNIDIRALSGIRTHDPSVTPSEDSS